MHTVVADQGSSPPRALADLAEAAELTPWQGVQGWGKVEQERNHIPGHRVVGSPLPSEGLKLPVKAQKCHHFAD